MILFSAALALAMQTAAPVRFARKHSGQVHLIVLPGCRIFIDRRAVSFAQLRAASRKWHDDQPEVDFRPDPEANRDCLDRVLAVLKAAKLTRLGFTGNEVDDPDSAAPVHP